jgi:hypothetical protein
MSQSNYLPWRGYFDFLDDVELFVFYDDVKYTHRTWRNRNRVKTQAGVIWLSVPVLHGHDTKVEGACIDYTRQWVDKHIRTLTLAYQKAPYFKTYAEELFEILGRRLDTISKLNVAICRWVMEKLSIRCQVRMSSEFGIGGDKFDRPISILKKIGASSYLAGPTAKPYTDAEAFRAAGIKLEFKCYEYDEYPQQFGRFEPGLSIVDLLFNCGNDARLHLKSLVPNEIAA